ncbi:hypothetical protein GOP47_0011879 [Adiantum capillus-veneris]|uniref:HpcH/HpaI aldolase/citrate lyase domain-containing protein n=1 Tax=Adiantum capillus-veneris TaxID=13818 RepID=A0A9D4UTQ3_ADICA|nr:hypothetical protein GOP47_0011879 [Adiantum capillus-veneris]
MAYSAMTALGLPPKKRSLKARLQAGEKVYGGFLVTQTPFFAEMMGLVGYDYVVVDLEHGPGETKAALQCLRALEAVGTPAIIRVGFNDQVLLKKALDLGPAGVIVPMVQNAERAAFAVSCCRYPPRGIRGAHPFVRATKFGLDKSYVHSYENDLLIICQIESAQAVDLIHEIAAVDGVDGLMIGPRDLSASIGCFADPTNPSLAVLIDKAEKAVLSSPRKVFLKGIARPELDPPPALYKRGYDIVSGTMDVVLFTTAALADIKAHRPLPLQAASTATAAASSSSTVTAEANGVHPAPHTNGGDVKEYSSEDDDIHPNSGAITNGNHCHTAANGQHNAIANLLAGLSSGEPSPAVSFSNGDHANGGDIQNAQSVNAHGYQLLSKPIISS